MINAYMLAESVNNSMAYGGGGYGYVEPYPFTGSLSECTATMAYEIMSEACSMNEMFAVTDEIMAEAAMSNPDVLDTLCEATFQSIIDGVKKFFDKIISMVTGIIDKLRAFFAKMTGNVDKWMQVMKPKITAVMGSASDWRSVTAEIYDYDENYIVATMPAGIGTLVANWRNDTGAKGGKDPVAGLRSFAGTVDKDVERNNQRGDPVTYQNPKTDNAINSMNQSTEALKNELKKKQEGFVGIVAKAFGTSAASSLDAVWSETARKARGGQTQRVTKTIGSEVDAMMKSLEASKQTIKDIADKYDTHLKDLKDYRKAIDDAKIGVSDNDRVPPPVLNAARQWYSAKQNIATTMTSLYEKALNRARELNISYAKDMCKEYMGALTKFANHKGGKTPQKP